MIRNLPLTHGIRALQTPFDADLARFVISRLEVLQRIAAKDESLLAFLRTNLPPRDRLQALLFHLAPDSEDIAVAVKTLSDSVGKVKESSILLAAFVEKYLKITDAIPAAPTGPAVRRASDHLTGDAMFIFDAIYRDKRLVIAEQDGRGALCSASDGAFLPGAHNDHFSVSRGEILVTLPSMTLESKESTRVVCNRHGEVGELFQELRLTPLQDAYSKFLSFPQTNVV